jgi:antitoxin component YwqK of YwqJK toxin-antitoxin module
MMNKLKIVFSFILFLFIRGKITAQEMPDFADSILLSHIGALPYYVACDDSVCVEKLNYPDGKLKAMGKCKNGKKVGLWSSYFENGKIRSVGILKNGFPYGLWTFYYENGKKKGEGEFILGVFELGCAGSGAYTKAAVMNKEWNSWHENGNLNSTYHFSPNKEKQQILNGPYTLWYENGNKKETGVYVNDAENGIITYWYEDGHKSKEEYYQYRDCDLFDYISYECPSGTWTYWNEDGTILKTETYVDGKLVEEKK